MMCEAKEQHRDNRDKTGILIIDNHSVARRALTQLINQKTDLVICFESANGDQALRAIETQQVDFAVVDISLKGTSGIQLAEKIKLSHPHLPVLMFSIHDEALFSEPALDEGTRWYIANREATEQITEAIRYV